MSDPNVEKKEAGPPPEDSSQEVPEKKKREYKEFGHEEEGPTREWRVFRSCSTILTVCDRRRQG